MNTGFIEQRCHCAPGG